MKNLSLPEADPSPGFTEDKHHVRRASVSSEAILTIGRFSSAMAGASMLSMTPASTLPAIGSGDNYVYEAKPLGIVQSLFRQDVVFVRNALRR